MPRHNKSSQDMKGKVSLSNPSPPLSTHTYSEPLSMSLSRYCYLNKRGWMVGIIALVCTIGLLSGLGLGYLYYGNLIVYGTALFLTTKGAIFHAFCFLRQKIYLFLSFLQHLFLIWWPVSVSFPLIRYYLPTCFDKLVSPLYHGILQLPLISWWSAKSNSWLPFWKHSHQPKYSVYAMFSWVVHVGWCLGWEKGFGLLAKGLLGSIWPGQGLRWVLPATLYQSPTMSLLSSHSFPLPWWCTGWYEMSSLPSPIKYICLPVWQKTLWGLIQENSWSFAIFSFGSGVGEWFVVHHLLTHLTPPNISPRRVNILGWIGLIILAMIPSGFWNLAILYELLLWFIYRKRGHGIAIEALDTALPLGACFRPIIAMIVILCFGTTPPQWYDHEFGVKALIMWVIQWVWGKVWVPAILPLRVA